MPRSALMPFALACVSHTRGFASLRNVPMGPATALAMPSASERPMRLGTSSPITMERYDTISVMTIGEATGATAVRGAIPNDSTR